MSRTQIRFGRPCRCRQGRFARQTRQHPRSTVAPPGGMRRNLPGAENLLRHSPSPLAKAALIVLRNRRSFRCVSLSRNPRRKFVAGEQEATKMPNCPKCEKPVYFAERKFSLGKDWHSACLRCEKCNKTLAPGSHAEHEGKPYCHQPCYSALYGPGGYGRGGAESYVYKK